LVQTGGKKERKKGGEEGQLAVPSQAFCREERKKSPING